MKSIRLKIVAIIFIAVHDLPASLPAGKTPTQVVQNQSQVKGIERKGFKAPRPKKALPESEIGVHDLPAQENSFFKSKANFLNQKHSSSLLQEQIANTPGDIVKAPKGKDLLEQDSGLSLSQEQQGVKEFSYDTVFKPESQEQGQFQEVPLMKNSLHLKAQTSTKAQEVQAKIQAQNFYARMGISLQAVVDALSRIKSATWQKIMDYLRGSKRLKAEQAAKLFAELVFHDSDIPLQTSSSSKSKQVPVERDGELIVKSGRDIDEKAAEVIAQLSPATAAHVLKIVAQAPELQARSGKPFVAPDQQILVEGKSGSIKMPVQKFAVSDPIVQAGSGEPFVAPGQKIVLNIKSQVGSQTLPVEIVQPVDVQQQQKDVIQKDFNSGMLLQEQLKVALKQKKDFKAFAQKQSKKGKFSDANNAVKTLSERIKLLQDQIEQEKIVKKKMKDDADVLPDVGEVLGKKSQEQTEARNPMKSVGVDKIPAPVKPVVDEPEVVRDLMFETVYTDQNQIQGKNPMKPVGGDKIPALTKPVVDEPEAVRDLSSSQKLQQRFQEYVKPGKARSPNYKPATYQQILTDVSLVGSDVQSGRLTGKFLHNPSVYRKIKVSELPSLWPATKSVTEENFEPVVPNRSVSLDDFE